MAEVKLTGFKELSKALKGLGPKVARNTLRRAVSAAAADIRDEARRIAPKDTGEMAKDIQIKRARDAKGVMSATYSVFVRSGKRSRLSGKSRDVQKDSFYWRFIEFGTAKMPAQPFLRPAFEARKERALEIIREKLDEGVQKAAAEVRK